MLRALQIENYAIVDRLFLQFAGGLNIITGETGAGKSILVEALTHLLGGRAGPEVIRHGEAEATLRAWFDAAEESTDPNATLRFKRVISRTGRGRSFLNDNAVALSTLRSRGKSLIEIHGQEAQDSLSDPDWPLQRLDAWSGLSAERAACAEDYRTLTRLRKEADRLREAAADGRQALWPFQFAEIEAARPTAGEEEELQSQERLLKNREAILSMAQTALSHLSDEGAILDRMGQVGRAISDLHAATGNADTEVALWETAHVQMKELLLQLRARLEADPPDPGQLDRVTARLYEIQRLKKKYGGSVEAILEYQREIAAKMAAGAEGQRRLVELDEKIAALSTRCVESATSLSKRRATFTTRLAQAVKDELNQLGMEKTTFHVELKTRPLSESGVDHAVFSIALPGEAQQPIGKVASGGERSRIMLALKAVLAAADPVPTLIFDEIDAGIGGGVAEQVGRRLAHLAESHQIFSITHLPQIAAFARNHYRVEKRVTNNRVTVAVQKLSEEERMREIARMLGGVTTTPITLRHAEEMIRSARTKTPPAS